jgi:hypothetical protein
MGATFSGRIRWAGLALAAVSAVALASVTFNSATGVGFVGKGDVQIIYGWNNQQLQSGAGNVQFRFQDFEVATWNCEKIFFTGPDQIEHDIIQVRTNITNTEGIVASVGRLKTQVTGFNLNGYSTLVITVNGPPVGS